MKDNEAPPANEFRGLPSTDPRVRAEVARRLRTMPFRDLVARIEGEAAAAAMEQENATKSKKSTEKTC